MGEGHRPPLTEGRQVVYRPDLRRRRPARAEEVTTEMEMKRHQYQQQALPISQAEKARPPYREHRAESPMQEHMMQGAKPIAFRSPQPTID